MVGRLGVGGAAQAGTLPVAGGGQPGVDENVLRGEPVLRLLLQQGADEALGSRAQAVGQVELTASDFGKQTAMLGTVERISENKRKLITF